MKKAIRIICFIAFLLSIDSCAPSRYVKPLGKGETAANLSFGGPLIRFSGAPVPIPFTTLGYGFGATDRSTFFGNLHLTSLLFGNLQTDIGSCISLFAFKESKAGVTVSPAFQMAYHLQDVKSFRIWPSIELNAYHSLKNKKSFLYAGPELWIEPSGKKAHDEAQTENLISSVHFGYMAIIKKWNHQLELKLLAPGSRNLPGVVEYIGFRDQGAFGIYYTVYMKF